MKRYALLAGFCVPVLPVLYFLSTGPVYVASAAICGKDAPGNPCFDAARSFYDPLQKPDQFLRENFGISAIRDYMEWWYQVANRG